MYTLEEITHWTYCINGTGNTILTILMGNTLLTINYNIPSLTNAVLNTMHLIGAH